VSQDNAGRADGKDDREDLLRALAGKCAAQECATADRTRRVVLTSLGVRREQAASCKRNRSIALAGLLLMVFALGPFVWHLTYELLEGEHICDITAQLGLAACVLFPAILAAALVAGWLRRRF
jgi:hypothetical protein